MAPVAETLKMALDPWPICQKNTMEPNTAASETRLSTTALSGSRMDRKVRTSRMNVMSAISASTYGNLL